MRVLDCVQTIAMMKKAGLRLNCGYTQAYTQEQIRECCARIIQHHVPQEYYQPGLPQPTSHAGNYGNMEVEKELLQNPGFAALLSELAAARIPVSEMSGLTSELRSRGVRITDFSVENIIAALSLPDLPFKAKCDYLRWFSTADLTEKQKSRVLFNLKMLRRADDYSDFTKAEMELLAQMEWDWGGSVPHDGYKKALQLLAGEESLRKLVLFLMENHWTIPFAYDSYRLLQADAEKLLFRLQEMHGLLQQNRDAMERFLPLWLENSCPLFDLEQFYAKLNSETASALSEALQSRAGYINLLYGGALDGIPFDCMRDGLERLTIYAITHKKKAFLRLLKENIRELLEFDNGSLLFHTAFYSKYVNLNTLNSKNLAACERLVIREWDISSLPVQEYTFDEIKALYGLPKQYIRLYAALNIPRLDDRLTAFRQVAKKRLLPELLTEDEIIMLAVKLSEKNLSRWLAEDFAHIHGASPLDAVSVLIHYDSIFRFIGQVTNRTELCYLLNNRKELAAYSSLEEVKKNLMEIDQSWEMLVQCIDLEDGFIERYRKTIQGFLLRNGAFIALTYCQQLDSDEAAAFVRIVRAELMGRFLELKYYADDLDREICFPLMARQIEIWKNSGAVRQDGITVAEKDDFISTMTLGEVPVRTCLSYLNGSHNQCLLSCFDSNKKVLYADIGGKTVGRSMLRLTKLRPPHSKTAGERLAFADLEQPSGRVKEIPNTEERLVLFLERMYFSHLDDGQLASVRSLMLKLAGKKADELGCGLIVSDDFKECAKDYAVSKCEVFISRTKAGAQYLDSLGGENAVTAKGSYKGGSFLLRQIPSSLPANPDGRIV